jgi:4-amino-4-deoxy-L-arabinose transferase-like glycosyltransferase
MTEQLNIKKILWLGAGILLARAIILFILVPAWEELSPITYQANMFPDGYDVIALNVAQGYGYRWYAETSETMIRTPGFVLVLAGLFWVFGKSLVAVKALNFLVTLGTAYIVYRLGTRVTKSSLCGGFAGSLCLLEPSMIIADSRGGVETLFAFSIALFMLVVYRAIEEGSLRCWALSGVAFGFVLLVRSTPAFFPLLLMMWLMLRTRTMPEAVQTFRGMLVFGLFAAIVMSPWIIRNFELTGRFVPTMTCGGQAAFEGLYAVKHSDSGKEFFELIEDAGRRRIEIADAEKLRYRGNYFLQFYSALDEVNYDKSLWQLVLDDLRTSPPLLAKALVHNAVSFWIQGRTKASTMINALLVFPFLALAICGGFMARRDKLEIMPILLLIVSVYLPHLLVQGTARYHAPLVPLIAILAAIPISGLFASSRFYKTPS